MAEILFPTSSERTAYHLRRRQGLKDHEIAAVMGVSRTWVNKLINQFIRKAAGIRLACADGTLLEGLP